MRRALPASLRFERFVRARGLHLWDERDDLLGRNVHAVHPVPESIHPLLKRQRLPDGLVVLLAHRRARCAAGRERPGTSEGLLPSVRGIQRTCRRRRPCRGANVRGRWYGIRRSLGDDFARRPWRRRELFGRGGARAQRWLMAVRFGRVRSDRAQATLSSEAARPGVRRGQGPAARVDVAFRERQLRRRIARPGSGSPEGRGSQDRQTNAQGRNAVQEPQVHEGFSVRVPLAATPGYYTVHVDARAQRHSWPERPPR